MKIQICMFVYNLEKTLKQSIQSVIDASAGLDIEVYVMCNGCKDESFSIAKKYSETDHRVQAVELIFGDKSETWNQFVYHYYDDKSIPLFLDGDLTFEHKAIVNIANYYLAHPAYNSVSSMPWAGGRSSEEWRACLLKHHEFTGNLYLLNPEFVQRVKSANIRLPVGLIGDDSMLGFLTATNLVDGTDEPLKRRGVCEDAVFIYEKLSPFSLADLKLYWRRRVRYSMRKLQQDEIVSLLKQKGIEHMPERASDVFKSDKRYLTWRGLDTVFDFIAIRRLKQ